MYRYNLKDFKKGWIVGAFDPTIINTNDVEVAIKIYNKGDSEPAHLHKIATEITVVLSGIISINGCSYYPNEIIKIMPNEIVSFESITDSKTVVVKFPGISNDKYVV